MKDGIYEVVSEGIAKGKHIRVSQAVYTLVEFKDGAWHSVSADVGFNKNLSPKTELEFVE